ncbi:MAG: hypothetical protein NC191_04485 [Muribaculaceae bacterium]|nr:hypothetical protein [Muribaculaceae bacterium]
MVNKIELATAMTTIVDEIYRTEAVTRVLEAPSELVRYSGGKSFQIANMSMDGLGDYSRQNGYPLGSVNLSWDTYQFTNDRGVRFSVDREDNEESFGIVASRLNSDFTRDHLIPEVDAYRFAKIAAGAGQVETGTIAKNGGMDAVDEAIVTLQDNKVPTSRLLLFVTPRVKLALEQGITRSTSNGEGAINHLIETYNNVPIITVPQDRFYSGITLLPGDGENNFGYEKSTDATDLNFILMDRAANVNITKLNMLKLFTPDENQKLDAWQWDYRLYHESFVFDNKKAGIYVHKKAS